MHQPNQCYWCPTTLLTLYDVSSYITQFSRSQMTFYQNSRNKKNPIRDLVSTQIQRQQNLSDFRDRCDEVVNKVYDSQKNNCYHYLMHLMRLLNCTKQQRKKLEQALNKHNELKNAVVTASIIGTAAGSIALGTTGSELGMVIGIVGGPFGIVIGGAIGGIVGGIAGSSLFRKLKNR